jgi:colicin import membrane protein
VTTASAVVYGPYGSRPRPALGRAAALSALVHLLLLAVMVLGVRMQSNPPATVTVELWEAPSPPPPQPVVEEKPPPPAPKPAPEPEPQVKKPDIVVPEKPKPKPKPEPKAEPKPQPKPKPDPNFDKRLREQAMAEEQQLQERALREQIARAQADARSRALLTWTDKIRAKIRGNIILTQDIPGNPEAIFDVTLLPTGEVLTVRKRKSSGVAAYDDAVERAIAKSSPLPQPDDRSVFQRQLELKFRPQDR